jgi:kynurenine 3-monooxygenase
MTNVKFFFNHKLVGADFKRNLAWFERRTSASDATTATTMNQNISPSEIEVSFDFMIGADGAHSAVRYHLMKFARMNYQQEYIDTIWCEFHMTPETSSGEPTFKISPNHLHIWPCGSFMFIAIPSADKSFTCTLFMSASKFQELDDNPQDLIPFFEKNFPGVVPDLISKTEVQHQYNNNPHLPLISIKCKPYHYKSSVVILGDAAHAMVPFYGQGMNAGLEDVRVLYNHLDRYAEDYSDESVERRRGKALSEYTQSRHPDAVAINDLALRNYQEMSHDVNSSMYLLRKFVEESLDAYLPSIGWATQYSRISFGNERYSEVEKAEKKQGTIMLAIIGLIAGTLGSWIAWRILRWNKARSPSTSLATWLVNLAKSSKGLVGRFISAS